MGPSDAVVAEAAEAQYAVRRQHEVVDVAVAAALDLAVAPRCASPA